MSKEKDMEVLHLNDGEIQDMVLVINNQQTNLIPNEYLKKIVDKLEEDIIRDIAECADPNEWNGDDLRMALGRVICEKIGAE